MNNYVVVLKSGKPIDVEADEAIINNGCAEFYVKSKDKNELLASFKEYLYFCRVEPKSN